MPRGSQRLAIRKVNNIPSMMRVPQPSGRWELKMDTGMPQRTAGAIVPGWSTLAPKVASSLASSRARLPASMTAAPRAAAASAGRGIWRVVGVERARYVTESFPLEGSMSTVTVPRADRARGSAGFTVAA